MSVPRTKARALRRKATSIRIPEDAPMLTVGHSTRTLEEFICLLKAHGATCVVDVRTVPRSRHKPQFNKAAFRRALKKAGRR